MFKPKTLITGIVLIGLCAAAVLVSRHVLQRDMGGPQTLGAVKVRGDLRAPVEIVEFSDFQCPACQLVQPLLKSLDEKYPGQIRLVFKHFPLAGHAWSGQLHLAAECAGEQGRFWEYHDALYAAQKELGGTEDPTVRLLGFAKTLGLDLDIFAVCVTGPDAAKRVTAERAEGEKLLLRSTPTFFINGTRVVGPREMESEADKIIAKALEEKKK
ncbi:MAG: hypothetical protein A2Z83_03660 [Omnitrophica bacterium GWA2_52_8]|nr:MAG: hypothetical protein A2Z83_03660 [Omnitrophica bacterium GWA2_52_8]